MKLIMMMKLIAKMKSPSSRRAWIEINRMGNITVIACVALLAEGVD